MWKERLWQVFLVAILGLTLTMCSRTGSNNNSSSSSNANAEETSVANAGPSAISGTMTCLNADPSAAGWTYYNCDATDDTSLATITTSGGYTYVNSITHDAAFAAGWKLVGPSCSSGTIGAKCFLFHK
jgi:hypothetical protein